MSQVLFSSILKNIHIIKMRTEIKNAHLNAVHPDVLFDSQGIRIIQSNTSFLLLKYTYIQRYMFQLHGAIIRTLP